MKPLIVPLIVIGALGSSAASGADAPPTIKAFKMDALQLQRVERMATLIKQLRGIDGPYEREINAWFREAVEKFNSASDHAPDGEWGVERRLLLKKLDELEARKDPRIDDLRNQIDKVQLDVIKSYRPDQEVPPFESPLSRVVPNTVNPQNQKVIEAQILRLTGKKGSPSVSAPIELQAFYALAPPVATSVAKARTPLLR